MSILLTVLGCFAIAIAASMFAAWVVIGGFIGGVSNTLEKKND